MKGSQILLECMVWDKDSHGLFDYESKDCKEFKFVVSPNSKLYRQGDNLFIIELNQNQQKLNQDAVLLGEFIQTKNGTIEFKPLKQNDKNQDAYLKLKSNKNGQQQYKIGTNDLIKLGRMQNLFYQCFQSEYFVSEVQGSDCITQIADDVFKLVIQKLKIKRQFFQDKHFNLNLNSGKVLTCKFCLVESCQDLQNPQLSINNNSFFQSFVSKLCNCQGNIEYVHFNCLSIWVNSRIEKKQTNNTVIYGWKKAMECEICKEPLPKRVFVNNNPKPLELIEVGRLPYPYIVLEQITRENSLSKSLVLIHSVNNESILLGRGNTCEIRSNDISVSRTHASLVWLPEDDQWVIEDQNSKFGTLLILPGNVVVEKEQKEVQIGRIVLKMSLLIKPLHPLQQKLTKLPQVKQMEDEEDDVNFN